MKVTRVTITGADESVEPADLVKLSGRFPWVEWGILFSPKRQGKEPRYPSLAWVDRLVHANSLPNLAAHLCGEDMRGACAGSLPAVVQDCWRHRHFRRIQLNGIAGQMPTLGDGFTWMIYGARPRTIILQVCSPFTLGFAYGIRKHDENVSALWDRSGGHGVRETDWPEPFPGMSMGYAGGIGPDNVQAVLTKLGEMKADDNTPAWIDMESGVRSEDGWKFDLDRVVDVLEKARPFIEHGMTAA